MERQYKVDDTDIVVVDEDGMIVIKDAAADEMLSGRMSDHSLQDFINCLKAAQKDRGNE